MDEVAELLGLSASAVYAGKCGTEKLTRLKQGRRNVRWSENEVLALIEQQLTEAQTEQARQIQPSNLVTLKDWTRKPKPDREEAKTILSSFKIRR